MQINNKNDASAVGQGDHRQDRVHRTQRGLVAVVVSGLLLALLGGCAGTPLREPTPHRSFDFDRDSFAYVNELDWEYRLDPATGKTHIHENEPRPQFVHRCFALSRMARQFFQYAKFDASLPKADDETYRRLIDAVVSRHPGEGEAAVVIPGYADLRSFSKDKEALLKDASGSSLHSYFQLSNWRMIFPFSRDHQQAQAEQMLGEIRDNRLPIVHLIRFEPFPLADINHVIVIIGVTETVQAIHFRVYDPNNAAQPVELSFDRGSRTFIFPPTNYFSDGPVNVYEIYGDDLN